MFAKALMRRGAFTPYFGFKPAMRTFSAVSNDVSDDLSEVKRFSLDAFYETASGRAMSDDQALEYMNFAAKMACVRFSSEEEMLSFKNDFSAALNFLDKLDEVDVKGVKPLGNVFEYYGGNEHNLRREDDFYRKDDDQTQEVNFKEELIKMNKHMTGDYVVFNKPKQFNPDSE